MVNIEKIKFQMDFLRQCIKIISNELDCKSDEKFEIYIVSSIKCC